MWAYRLAQATWKDIKGSKDHDPLQTGTFYPLSTMFKEDIATVSVCPSEMKVLLQPQFFTDPYQIYTACMKMKNSIICRFMKKCQKLLPWHVHALIHICLCLFLT